MNLDFILTGLQQLDNGYALFDSDQKMVSCNRRFGELRDYPDAICQPGTSFRAMLEYAAARGDFGDDGAGEVERRLATHWGVEATQIDQATPAGLILRIFIGPVPGGGMLLSYTDITDLRQTEERLRESETRHALVTEASTEGLYDWDIVADSLYVSPRLNEMFEFSAGRLRAAEWVARIHADDRVA